MSLNMPDMTDSCNPPMGQISIVNQCGKCFFPIEAGVAIQKHLNQGLLWNT